MFLCSYVIKSQTDFDSLSSTDYAVCELKMFEEPALYKGLQLLLITVTI